MFVYVVGTFSVVDMTSPSDQLDTPTEPTAVVLRKDK